jgi:hypothetical protein
VEDWLDILLRGTYEVTLPSLTVTSGEIGTLTGSGQVTWNADAGIRIQAVTDGGNTVNTLRLFFRDLSSRPGYLIPESTFLTFSGRTPEGWELTADHMPRRGYYGRTNLPAVVWDLRTSGITLWHESSAPRRRSLRILMGPPPRQWVRETEIEVRNEVFRSCDYKRDWLTTTCRIGRVLARHRSDDWFEVQVLPNEGDPVRETNAISTSIARAFGFVLGRRCVIRGYEEVDETRVTRRLDIRYAKTTRNTLLQPLGSQLQLTDYVEPLLGLAIDFFLTELGERIAPYLDLCWDTADNVFETRLLISSVCVEGLLRLAAETINHNQPQADRATGIANNPSANTIFRDWVACGVLGVTKDDWDAWRDTRNPLAHGRIPVTLDQLELQTLISRHIRLQNLMNKIILQFMDYNGQYIDYSQPDWPPAEFPVFVSRP